MQTPARTTTIRTTLRLLTLAATALLIAAPTAALRAADPAEIWLGFTAKTPISPRVTALVLLESKFRDDLDFRYQDYADIGVSIQLNDQWSVAPIMRFVRTRSTPGGPWSNIICPLPTVNWQDSFAGWKLGWRNQLEIQCRESRADMTTWRTRMQVMPPMPKDGSWHPYLNNEFFFDDHSHRWSQNRALLGTYYTINKAWTLETYIGYKSDWAAGNWNHTRLIGTRAGWAF